MKRLSLFALAATTLVILTGCAGSGSTALGAHNPRIRVFNADQTDGNVDVRIDNSTAVNNLAYEAFDPYGIFNEGNRTVEIKKTSNQSTLFNDNSNLFELNKFYTLVVLPGAVGTANPLLLTDDQSSPNTGRVHLRFTHVAPTFQGVTLNVYVTAPGAGLPVNPTTTLTYRQVDALYLDLPEGTDEIRILRADTSATLYDQNVSLTSMQVRTAAITNNNASATDVVLLPDLN